MAMKSAWADQREIYSLCSREWQEQPKQKRQKQLKQERQEQPKGKSSRKGQSKSGRNSQNDQTSINHELRLFPDDVSSARH